jgi:hypothetical protein
MRFELCQGAEHRLEHTAPVELLAWDEWIGLVSLPEILAAFVMRNHLHVERLLRGPPISWGARPASSPFPATSQRTRVASTP